MPRTFISIFSFLILCSVAYGDDAYVMGAGNASCGKWLKSKDSPESRALMGQWMSGFISGTNWSSPKKQAMPSDQESMEAFVDQYCNNNPLHSLVLAAAALVQETGGPKAQHKWKK